MSLFYHMERLQAPHKVRMSPFYIAQNMLRNESYVFMIILDQFSQDFYVTNKERFC